MEIKIIPTPNPLSKKFVISQIINQGDKLEINDPKEAEKIPMAVMIMSSWGIKKIALFANTITVTIYPDADWDQVEDEVMEIISLKLPTHNPNLEFTSLVPQKEYDSPEHERIEKIIDEYIRPVMQADGGDIEVLKYESETKSLFVSFQGACGSCPSALYGTLEGIKNILQEKFDQDLKVYLS